MTIRIKFIIKDDGFVSTSRGKVNLKDRTVSVELSGEVQIQEETNNRTLREVRSEHGRDKFAFEIKKLEIVANDEKSARKIYALLHLKHKLIRENGKK